MTRRLQHDKVKPRIEDSHIPVTTQAAGVGYNYSAAEVASRVDSKSADSHTWHFKDHVQDQHGVELRVACKCMLQEMVPKYPSS